MLTLTTVIYGDNQDYRTELFGSVLSILRLRQSEETRVVVYTDKPLPDFPLPVTERIIPASDWKEWTHDFSITHLVKLHLLQHALAESGDAVIYFDTDTLFVKPPEQLAARLAADKALMHAAEGLVADHPIWRTIVAWLGEGREVAGVRLTPGSVMYNSGIVGVLPAHAAALQRSVEIADALFKVDPIFSLDQFSTGCALGHQATVTGCDDAVLHYWGWNRGFVRKGIAAFRQHYAGADLSTLCRQFDPTSLTQLPPIDWRDRLANRVYCSTRSLSNEQRFSRLALLTAQRQSGIDSAIANLWFDVHLRMLELSSGDSRDTVWFQQHLAPKQAACLDWLNAGNRQRLKHSGNV